MSDSVRRLRIFLSSPGDVGHERALALKVFDQLAYDPLLRGKISIETVAWDKPGSDAPLLATMTPQEAINLALPKPSDCDIVIVIFWKRFGTPLPYPEYQKPNGERYYSGTEWEFWDAVQAASKGVRPQVVLYRRQVNEDFLPDDEEYEAKMTQYQRVKDFFAAFTDPDGALIRGFNMYVTTDEFRTKLETHLRFLVEQLLEHTETTTQPAMRWQGLPFPGLRPFLPSDFPIYYGRDEQVDQLVKVLKGSSIVVVSGPSGSGKSSLIGAGLIPALTANAIEGSKDWLLPTDSVPDDDGERSTWCRLYCRPDEVNPFLPTARAFQSLLTDSEWNEEQLAHAFADETCANTISSMLERILADKAKWAEVLLFIDQFEELFTHADERYHSRFLDFVMAYARHPRARVVLSMRADFDTWLQQFTLFAHLVGSNTILIGMPSAGAIIQMITRPAERAGVTFEDGLVEQILDDFVGEAGSLPLLAFTLEALWQRSATENQISKSTYDAIGGVTGAINQRAAQALNHLQPEIIDVIPMVFSRLATVREDTFTRLAVDYAIFAVEPKMQQLVDAFVEARLLVRSANNAGQVTIEVAHDALLNEWSQLNTYLLDRRDFLAWRERFDTVVQSWRDSKYESSYLYQGRQLLIARSWQQLHRDEMSDDENDFIDDSWRRYVVRRGLTALAVFALLVIVALLTAGAVRQALLRSQARGPVIFYDDAGMRFGIDQFEISVFRYRQCMAAGACGRPLSIDDIENPDRQDYPVVSITAVDAQNFCDWLGMRLPTAPEWAYAAFGTPPLPYPWGSAPPSADRANVLFDTGQGSGSLAHVDAQGYLAGGRNGVMHLVGNAAEWTTTICEDTNRDGAFTAAECRNIWQKSGEIPNALQVVGLSYLQPLVGPEDLREIHAARPVLGADRDIGFRCVVSG